MNKQNRNQNNGKGKGGRYMKYGNTKQSKERNGDQSRMIDKIRQFINPSQVTNDVSWYTNNPQLVKDACQLSFFNPLGEHITLNEAKFTVPGIMAFDVLYGPGVSQKSVDPVNQAALGIYGEIRKANSGAKNYESSDVMLLLMGLDSIYAMYSFATRIYGILTSYSQVNRYTPRALCAAMGVNFDDFQNNIADFRYYLNTLPTKVSQFAAPAVMPLFKRHAWLFNNIYRDGTTNKSQYYLLNPAGYYTWEEETEGKVGYLKFNPLTNRTTPLTLADLEQIFETMIDKLLGSQDVGIICGDILKAYGDSGLITLSQIPEDFTVEPVMDLTVLSQIQNATITDCAIMDADLTQSTGIGTPTFRWQPQLYSPRINLGFLSAPKMLTMSMDVPTPEDIIEATRLTAFVKQGSSSNYVVSCMGTEIITTAHIVRMDAEGSPEVIGIANCSVTNLAVPSGVEKLLDDLSMWQAFDWAPAFNVAYKLNAQGEVKYLLPYLEYNNYRELEEKELAKIHRTAILSEFALPYYGAFGK